MSPIDPSFSALPFEALADAALSTASGLGATYAAFRFERTRQQVISTRDRTLQNLRDNESIGFGVRLVVDGSWGFASAVDLTPEAAADAARRATDVARTLSALNVEPVALAEEPVHVGEYISTYAINPFSVPDEEKIALLLDLHERILRAGLVDHASAEANMLLENKFYADLAGTRTTQQRVRMMLDVKAVKVDRDNGSFQSMGLAAPPVGQGWEWAVSGYPFASEADELPELLDEKMKAPSVDAGPTDLVIDPTNLWLTIHESIGHSTELDRVLGYEANYAGTSFATLDKLNTLQFGSPVMNVTGDRNAQHGLSSVGWDDEGVASQEWDIIKDGVLVGYQLDRQMALKQGFGRSNGCAFADAPGHVPIQRMPNVSLQASPDPITLPDLIGGVDDGIYIVGDGSWSIDMQRYNFQFTGQRFYRIKSGELAGQVKDVAYQSNTTNFWNSMEAVGGPETYLLAGAFNCGKGQPGQVAPVSHGCPAALFRGVNVLNTTKEGAR